MGNTSHSEPVSLEDMVKTEESKISFEIRTNSGTERIIAINENGDIFVKGELTTNNKEVADALVAFVRDGMEEKPITSQDLIAAGFSYFEKCPVVEMPVWAYKDYEDGLLGTTCYIYNYYPHAKKIRVAHPILGAFKKEVSTLRELKDLVKFFESLERMG